MTQSTKDSDLAQIGNDLAALKADLATLMEHIRDGGIERAEDALGRLDSSTRKLYQNLSAEGRRSAEAIGRQVEEQPLTSLALAFGVGLIVGRLLSR